MLPKDPNILFSLINTRLRDKYASLAELCGEEGESEDEIKAALAAIGCRYDDALNAFVAEKSR